MWLALMVAAFAMTLVFLPTGRRQVIAFVVLGLAVVARPRWCGRSVSTGATGWDR